jgi:hypothetical protein
MRRWVGGRIRGRRKGRKQIRAFSRQLAQQPRSQQARCQSPNLHSRRSVGRALRPQLSPRFAASTVARPSIPGSRGLCHDILDGSLGCYNSGRTARGLRVGGWDSHEGGRKGGETGKQRGLFEVGGYFQGERRTRRVFFGGGGGGLSLCGFVDRKPKKVVLDFLIF